MLTVRPGTAARPVTGGPRWGPWRNIFFPLSSASLSGSRRRVRTPRTTQEGFFMGNISEGHFESYHLCYIFNLVCDRMLISSWVTDLEVKYKRNISSQIFQHATGFFSFQKTLLWWELPRMILNDIFLMRVSWEEYEMRMIRICLSLLETLNYHQITVA